MFDASTCYSMCEPVSVSVCFARCQCVHVSVLFIYWIQYILLVSGIFQHCLKAVDAYSHRMNIK